MKTFYRKAVSIQESFILKNLNKEIEIVLSEIIGVLKGGKVLDIGCGEQPLKLFFNEKGFSYKSLDYKQNIYGTVDYINKIDGALNILESFDILICTEVMEHVLDWQTAFKNFSKLLNHNGLLLITCPMFYPLHEEPFDYWRPTPYAIKMFSENNGFNIVKEKKLGECFDLIGTILSNSYFYPTNQKWVSKINVKIINRFREFLLNKLMNHDKLNIVMESPYFMSNLFLLKKYS